MSEKQLSQRSFRFLTAPRVTAWASAVGKKEGQGPLGSYFDCVVRDSYWGEKTWEQAEAAMQQTVLRRMLRKAELPCNSLGPVFSGDLLNQCVGSSFPLRNTGIPHVGLYGACSTMAEALILSALTVDGGYENHCAAMTSSHFCSAERQYRLPLNYGGQRTPTAQWTVTGAGAALISREGQGPRITGCTLGTVTDWGIRDPANMGAAMAPSVLSSLQAHFKDFGTCMEDYDLVVTGDLGQLGREILTELLSKEGISVGDRLRDCGCMIFDPVTQNVGAGGSGAGCSASVLCSLLLRELNLRRLQKILFCGTGALLSPLTTQQKLSIPGICHCVVLEAPPGQ